MRIWVMLMVLMTFRVTQDLLDYLVENSEPAGWVRGRVGM